MREEVQLEYLVGREFGKPRCRREGTIKMDLTEIWYNGVDSTCVV
jgi:hypothetical protein